MSMAQTQSGPGAEEREAQKLHRLIELGIALSAERDHHRLMERILLEAKSLTNADGGTLYLHDGDQDALTFAIVRNDSLNIALGGTTGKEITFPPLRLCDPETGKPNHSNVATHTALTGATVNIEDAYHNTEFDFSGTRKFDQGTGYRSKSFLTVPLKNYQGEVIGVLQLINARNDAGTVIPFDASVQPLVEALASQAAVALDNQNLIRAQKALMDSFIEVIAGAIDAKSPYTGGHCQRVPAITKMLAKAAAESDDPRFKDFDLNEEEWYELHLAAWLHDCGKVTTPEYVVDKSTKLETIYYRIHEIRTRFEVLHRDAEIAYLKQRLDGVDEARAKAEFDARTARLQDDWAFIAECNIGGEFMSDEKKQRLKAIGETTWTRYFDRTMGLSWTEGERCKDAPSPPATEKLLDDRPDHRTEKFNLGEIYNLQITRGTLTDEERKIINDHIVLTIEMLNQLPFPKHLRRVPEYAGGHHEKMDGTGYPNGLTRDQMSLPARMMAIADIYEALTAADRPYKKAKKLSEAVKIMSFMNKDNHIYPDLFELFLKSGVYREYAEEYLLPEQLDEVDISQYLPQAAQ